MGGNDDMSVMKSLSGIVAGFGSGFFLVCGQFVTDYFFSVFD